MSLAGSIASTTLRSRIEGGQRHLDDDPVHRRVGVQRRGSSRRRWPRTPRRRPRRAGPRSRPSRSSGGSAGGRPSTARPGRRSRPRGPAPGRVARGRPPRPRRPPAGSPPRSARPGGVARRPSAPGSGPHVRSGSRDSPWPRVSWAVAASCWMSSTISFTRDRHLGRVGVVADRRQVDEDVRGGSVRGRLAEERRDADVARRVGVAAAGERLGRGDDREHASSVAIGTSDAHRAAARMAVRRASCSASVSLGSFSRRREGRVRLGVLIGEIEEAGRELAPGRGGLRRGAPRAPPSASAPGRARPPSPRGPRRATAATAEALPPPGTGAPDASSSTKAATVRSRKEEGRSGSGMTRL